MQEIHAPSSLNALHAKSFICSCHGLDNHVLRGPNPLFCLSCTPSQLCYCSVYKDRRDGHPVTTADSVRQGKGRRDVRPDYVLYKRDEMVCQTQQECRSIYSFESVLGSCASRLPLLSSLCLLSRETLFRSVKDSRPYAMRACRR
jgi:hypothetical protein